MLQKVVTAMTNEQFQREKNYQVSNSVIKSMLKQEIISKEDYKKIDTVLLEKYRPSLSVLRQSKRL